MTGAAAGQLSLVLQAFAVRLHEIQASCATLMLLVLL